MGGVDYDGYGVGICRRHPADVADKAAAVHVRTLGTNGNNVIGRNYAGAGSTAKRCIAVAGGVVRERASAHGRIEAAVNIAIESTKTDGCVVAAVDVVRECYATHGGVVTTGVVAKKSAKPIGRIGEAGGVVKKGQRSVGCVLGAGASA